MDDREGTTPWVRQPTCRAVPKCHEQKCFGKSWVASSATATADRFQTPIRQGVRKQTGIAPRDAWLLRPRAGIAVASCTPVNSPRTPPAAGAEFLSRPAPRLPCHGLGVPTAFAGISAGLHVTLIVIVVIVASIRAVDAPVADPAAAIARRDPFTLVFMVDPGPGGGGGGGNRQSGPVSRAQAPGPDSITLPVAKPIAPASQPQEEARPAQIVALKAKPLASDSMFQVGLLEGPISVSPSLGPGSGGGVGDGTGTGIGSGHGPGVGPGSGGGTGGGVYRPGGGASAPTVLREVRPS